MLRADYDGLLRIFAATLAPLLGAGCGIDEEQFTVDACSLSDSSVLEDLSPTTAVDYIELRVRDEEEESALVVGSSGVACSGAVDPQACSDTLEAISNETELVEYDSVFRSTERLLVYTRGDEVGAIRDQEALQKFLGAADTFGEVALRGRLLGTDLLCSEPAQLGEHPEGYVLYTVSGDGCGVDIDHNVVLLHTDWTSEVIDSKRHKRGSRNCYYEGRLPAGFCRRPGAGAATAIGSYLADAAHMEAASVPAFAQLRVALTLHRAPRALIRGAEHARVDEVRHARVMAHHARRFGGRPLCPRVLPTSRPSLAALAEDNVVEGCVRETTGALLAHVQALRAQDPALRRTLAMIARDETRHAALSWSLHRWAAGRLGPAVRSRLARVRAQTLERFRSEVTEALDPTVHRTTGLPDPTTTRALFDGLHRRLSAATS